MTQHRTKSRTKTKQNRLEKVRLEWIKVRLQTADFLDMLPYLTEAQILGVYPSGNILFQTCRILRLAYKYFKIVTPTMAEKNILKM